MFDKFNCCMSGDGTQIASGTYGNQMRVIQQDKAWPDKTDTLLEASRDPLRRRHHQFTPRVTFHWLLPYTLPKEYRGLYIDSTEQVLLDLTLRGLEDWRSVFFFLVECIFGGTDSPEHDCLLMRMLLWPVDKNIDSLSASLIWVCIIEKISCACPQKNQAVMWSWRWGNFHMLHSTIPIKILLCRRQAGLGWAEILSDGHRICIMGS